MQQNDNISKSKGLKELIDALYIIGRVDLAKKCELFDEQKDTIW